MSDEEFEREVLDGVSVDRRGFVKRMVFGAAFAVPVISSFSMVGATAESVDAISPNQGDDFINELCKNPAVQEQVAAQFGVKANHGQCKKALREFFSGGGL